MAQHLTVTPRQLSCVQDSQSYGKTLAALRAIEADEILLHDGARGRVLSSKVVGAFHGDTSRVLFVSRQYFDQDKVNPTTWSVKSSQPLHFSYATSLVM